MRWKIGSAVLMIAGVSACGTRHHRNFGGLPGEINSAVDEGGPNPATIPITLSNPGSCPLSYVISDSTVDGVAWLATSPNSGTVAAGLQQAIDVTIDVVTVPLAPGTYTGSITVSGTCADNAKPAAGSPGVVAVNLTVKPHRAGLVLGQTVIDQDSSTLADLWSPLTGGPTARGAHTAVWTGSEMIVWGGGSSAGGSYLDDGAAYDPVTDLWRALPPSGQPGRAVHAAVWTGSRMMIWGGSLSTGGETNTGALYDPAMDTWTPTTTAGAPEARNYPCAVWAGSVGKVIIFGGGSSTATPSALSSGALYDPATDTWMPTSSVSEPSARSAHTLVWTGEEMLLFGGGAAADSPDNATYR